MKERLAHLEHSVLELGSEIFRLKHSLTSMATEGEKLAKAINTIRTILDEKGVVSMDDFECAMESDRVTDIMKRFQDQDPDFITELLKKKGH